MKGYWHGPYTGSNAGNMVVEVDDRGGHFEGYAYAYDANQSLPSTFAVIKTPDKKTRGELKAPLAPLHPNTGEPTDWQVLQKLFPNQNVIVPKEAEVEYEWDDKQLSIKWKTDVGTFGSADIPRSEAEQPFTSQPHHN